MKFSQSKLKEMRRARGMTQPDLAAAVGVHYLTVGLWEGNRHRLAPNGCVPTPENFAALCHALGCEPSDLFEEQPDASRKETADHRERGDTNRSLGVTPDDVR